MIVETYPLSPIQEGMLFRALGSEAGVNVEQLLLVLPEEVDEEALVAAWRAAVARHAVLRTRFRWGDSSEPSQEVLDAIELPITRLDWRGLSREDRETERARLLATERARGFDLRSAPLFRLHLVRIGEAETWLLWTRYHGILDGGSTDIVLLEVFAVYDGRAGDAPSFAPPVPFADHVRAVLARDRPGGAAFFARMLRDVELPTPTPLARESSGIGRTHAEIEARLPKDAHEALVSLAREAGVTMNTVIQAAWAIVLARYADEPTVVFGTTRAGRHAVEGGDRIVGLLINTVPMRADVRDELTLRALLQELRALWIAMRPFEQTHLTEVREALQLRGSRPLFDTLLVFDSEDMEYRMTRLGGAWANRRFQRIAQTDVPLTLAASVGDTLILRLERDVAAYSADVAQRCLAHLTTVLTRMPAHLDRVLAELDVTIDLERDELLALSTGPVLPLPEVSLHGLVWRASSEHGARIALSAAGHDVAYADLRVRVRRAAARLAAHEVAKGARVGTLLPRGPEVVQAWLAILERGASFVPLDPDHPHDHVAHVIRDAGIRVVVTTAALEATLAGLDVRCVLLDREEEAAGVPRSLPPPPPVDPSDEAYVVYTSGSTGLPKGVAVSHRAIVNHTLAVLSAYDMVPSDRVLQFASPAFDVALEEAFPTLVAGAALVRRDEELPPPLALNRWIEARELTVLNLPTAYWHEWAHGLSEAGVRVPACVRLVVVGGERALPAAYRRFRAVADARVGLINAYGPTEATVTATVHDDRGAARVELEGELPIGRPVSNARAYVLDSRRHLVPIRVPGELYLGGPGVAIGYVGREDLTRERFVPDPFSGGVARMYRTGDRVRWRADGRLEFLGRVDDQIKVRGFRIEPAALERTLIELDGVHDAAVVLLEQGDAAPRLVAYVASAARSGVTPAALRARLASRFPAGMLPTEYVVLRALPRKTTGKIDRLALPVPATPARAAPTEPQTPIEELFLQIWRGALGRNDVGLHDSFFDLGGHSLLVLKVIDAAARAGVCVTTEQLLRYPTIAELSAIVVMATPEPADGSLVALRAHGERPPLFLVLDP